MAHAPRMAVLTDGGLAGLAAMTAARDAAVLSQPGGAAAGGFAYPGVMAFPPELWSDGYRMAAISRQAEALTLTMMPRPEVTPVAGPGSASEWETACLLSTAFAAARAGASRVVWPATGGIGDQIDIDRACEIQDKAILVSRLVSLDASNHGQPGFTIETPYADLTDDRLADLALDLGVRPELCWWFGPGAAMSGDEAQRWTRALARAGVASR
ncbi:MAG: hypothetical protein ACOYN0_11750, partial [Phycisphaerales bacterium]